MTGAAVRTGAARLLAREAVGPLLALLAAVLVFSLATDTFWTAANLSLLLEQSVVIALLALGQTLIVLTGGIDLANGAIAVLGTLVMARHAAPGGGSGALTALALGLAVCAGLGGLSGTLVTRLRLPPFIVTLGLLTVVSASARLYSQSRNYPVDAELLVVFGRGLSLGGGVSFSYGALLMLGLFALLWYVLTRTRWGRHLYAIGGNREAARLMGIPVDHRLVAVYATAGLLYGVAAWAALGRIPNADANAYQTANLDSITAVVIGGTSLFGGRGSVVGTLAGALIVSVLRSGLTQAGIDALYQDVATGILVVLAVAVDQASRRVGGAAMTTTVLEGRGLAKRFGQVTALDGADFDLRAGEVLAVVGDNGAGKSTLIKILSGALLPDSGDLMLDGKPVSFRGGPLEARRAGIETVYQDLAVAPALDVAANLFLGRELRRPGPLGTILRRLDDRAMQRQAADHLAALNVGIQSMTQPVETLSGGQRQAVAVARAAAFASRLIIMDEPTAALGVKESAMVLALIRRIRDRGLPVVLISHNMPHVFEVADRIHIQRLGRRAAVVTPQTHTMPDVVAIMTGARPA